MTITETITEIIETITKNHGIYDSKGRSIGGACTIWQNADGTYGLRCQATRDSYKFGAINVRGATACASLEEARRLAGVLLEQQGRRYRARRR